MDPLNPWIDASEVRRLAMRLMRPSHDQQVSVADAGFDSAFVGFAAESQSDPIPEKSPGIAEPAPPASEVPVIAPAPASSEMRGPLLERLRTFRDWLGTEYSASGVFILDREGAVIFDENSHNRLHFLARSLAMASRRPGNSAANVHVKISAASTLEVIPVDTPYGCIVLGAVVPGALPNAAVQSVMATLAQIMDPVSPA
jgi:hypothetical protein